MKLMTRTPKKKNDKVEVDFDNDVDIKPGPAQAERMYCAFAFVPAGGSV